ncbi:hypothetical protein JRO89_XS01G0156000 [Xanthoceras sorbifolium]|uniref:Uncharacterized protein n=1 Tax=Xanthoceras sorbifolium TaxID=99658 RepID=A0ABQ8IJH7_9ROSI|nr:hypothetical protein JRO89_XS01G0156000 [Xanthoceras sorbifolium]
MLMAKMAGTGCVSVLSLAAVSPAAPLDALFMRALKYWQSQGENYYYCSKKLEELKERTRVALWKSSDDPTATVKLIDDIQRLGVGHHFEEEINLQLERASGWKCCETEDLFANARRFRLLRQNGWPASTDIFKQIPERGWEMEGIHNQRHMGNFKRCIAQALELPRHLRMARLEARKYIYEYSREWNHNLALLELAKLDFNMVQSLHQRELVEIQRNIANTLYEFSLQVVEDYRGQALECFLWTVGIFPEPHYSNCRIELTKTIAFLLVVDDIFDTYGSLSDLVLFTNAIQRWDLDAMEQIPEYMKICYMALYNTTNEISFRILKEHGWNVVPQLKRTWTDIFEAQLAEAKWFNKGDVPHLEEYLANGVTTGGTYMALVHAFFLMGQGVTRESSVMMEPYPRLSSCAGKILRLWDDLGTAREEEERGDVASSMACNMRENTLSCEEEARKHIRQLIRSLWVELNGQLTAPAALPLPIIHASLNLARTSQVVYQNGDDYTNTTYSVKEYTRTLFSDSISLEFPGSTDLLAVGKTLLKN